MLIFRRSMGRTGPAVVVDGGDGFPDFQTLYALQWQPSVPEEPDVSGAEVQVNSLAQLNTAIATPGRTIRMLAATYGDIAISGTDLDIIVDDGAVIGACDLDNCDHVRVRGANPRGLVTPIRYIKAGGINFTSAMDHVRVTGLRTFDNGTTATSCTFNGRNSMLDSCYLHTASYGVWANADSAGRPTDWTIWNNYLDSGNVTVGLPFQNPQHTMRLTGIERGCVIGNFLGKHATGLGPRIYTKADFEFAYNIIEFFDKDTVQNDGCVIDPTGDSGTAVNTTYGIRWHHNKVYNDGSDVFNALLGDGTVVRVHNNDAYGVAYPADGTSTPSGFLFTSNSNHAAASPDAWDFYPGT